MDRCRVGLMLVVLLLAVGCRVGMSEIHRAKSLNVKPRPHHHNQYQYPSPRNAFLNPSSDDVNASDASWMHTVVWGHETQTWLFSILSASLVGLSGIFPLVIIPIDAGKSLRSGAASDGLKLLLSFAVGGLLGDVFLHLLPEAWAHLQRLGGDHKGHMQVGLWILTGLLSFFIIQKIFPEFDDGEEDEGEDKVKTDRDELKSDVCKTKQKNTRVNGFSDSLKPYGVINGRIKQNGMIKKGNEKNGLIDEISKNGSIKNGLNKSAVIKNRSDTTRSKNGFDHPNRANGSNRSCGSKNGGMTLHRMDENDNPLIGWSQSLKNWVTGRQETGDDDVDEAQSQCQHIKTSGWLNLLANMIDNFTHGLAVAGSFTISTKTGLLTTIAILLHEIPHEIGDFAILLKAGFDRWKAAKAQLLTATGGMLGALIALAAESTKAAGDTTAWVLPFTAGGFIYIALVTVVPDLLKETNPWNSLKQVVCLCAGIATMAMVTVFVD